MLDEYDNDDADVNPTNGTVPTDYPDEKQPGGDDMDWREWDNEGVVLPVVLFTQSLNSIDNSVSINWATSSEINNNQFHIEKSTDGFSFSTVGFVNGAVNSNVLINYNLLDNEPYNGLSYYRISQIDFDGTTKSFPLMTINLRGINNIAIYPNPTRELVTINSNQNGNAQVYNVSGKLVKVIKIKTENNLIDVSDLSIGVYTIRLIFDNKIITESLIIQ